MLSFFLRLSLSSFLDYIESSLFLFSSFPPSLILLFSLLPPSIFLPSLPPSCLPCLLLLLQDLYALFSILVSLSLAFRPSVKKPLFIPFFRLFPKKLKAGTRPNLLSCVSHQDSSTNIKIRQHKKSETASLYRRFLTHTVHVVM